MKYLYTKENVENELEELFNKYVPRCGKADTVGGEIVRAISRIGYRNFNDGDHIGVGYGNETCNAPARYLKKFVDDVNVHGIIDDLWGTIGDDMYDVGLDKLEMMIVMYLHQHMELFETVNLDDMWNYRMDSDFHYDDIEQWLCNDEDY